ncbi:MAG: hypothetical protein AAF438_06825 [Pseudomonadota bacterium]
MNCEEYARLQPNPTESAAAYEECVRLGLFENSSSQSLLRALDGTLFDGMFGFFVAIFLLVWTLAIMVLPFAVIGISSRVWHLKKLLEQIERNTRPAK